MPAHRLTSAEIKQHALTLIEERLAQGPVHLMKHNRREAVVRAGRRHAGAHRMLRPPAAAAARPG